MSGWGMATCHVDGEPLVSTLEFRGAEFVCVVCERKYGFFDPHGVPETPELRARYDELRDQWRAGRDARKAATS